jgi:RimJ/RimL family protein N-acetyltransferase
MMPFAMIHVSVATSLGTASVRDVEPVHVDTFVRYWHFSGYEHLDYMGIDRQRLGTPEETRARFLRAIRNGTPEQAHVAFSITLDGRLVGYSNLNRHAPDENYPHLHLVDASARAAGVASVVVPHMLKLYVDLYPIRRLVIQTRTSNTAINRVLDKVLPVAETRHLDTPDGLAAPGEFHVRYLTREQAAELALPE